MRVAHISLFFEVAVSKWLSNEKRTTKSVPLECATANKGHLSAYKWLSYEPTKSVPSAPRVGPPWISSNASNDCQVFDDSSNGLLVCLGYGWESKSRAAGGVREREVSLRGSRLQMLGSA
mgnify:CR=1 FL=1